MPVGGEENVHGVRRIRRIVASCLDSMGGALTLVITRSAPIVVTLAA